jgi:hypothetical protein
MSVTVGGPPATARHVRSVAVLRAAPLLGCAVPGAPGKRDNRADDDGRALPATKAKPLTWTHIAHRAAMTELQAARLLERRVVVWQMPDGGWWVQVHDGWGRLVEDYTPVPYTDLDTAREVANAAVDALRAQGAAEPARWQVVPARPRRAAVAPT